MRRQRIRVYIANSTFANNIADDRGGAIYMQTATAVDVFSPVIVNCTFVGNLGSNGGAFCVWSKATTTMEPTFVNNLFAENYSNTWMDDESRFDIVAFYMAGQVDANNQPLPQTVLPVCKNNLYVAASDGFFADGSNKAVNFDSDVIFAATEQNPWDEGDESYNHQTSVLSGDMKIAMIAENSIASGAGIAVVDGVEIPTVDQLGNARPATPSVGAVEYSSLSGITENVKDVVRIWNSGNIVYATGLNKAATAKVYSMTGGLVYEGIIANHSALELPIEEGVYLIVVDKAIQKLIIK